MKFTIVTAVYNGASTIGTTLASVAMQDRISPDGHRLEIEHLIVDGASTDGTAEQARSYPAPIRVISEPDSGIYDGMNKGLARAEGDVVGILNADDFYFSPQTLGLIADTLTSKRVHACYGNVIYVDTEQPRRILRVWRSKPYNARRFSSGWMPPHPAFFIRRECYERFGVFREDMGTAGDYELMLRFLLRYRVSCAYVPQLWVAMRAGGASNASLAARLRANYMDRRAWAVNNLRPYPGFRILKPARKLLQFARTRACLLQNNLDCFLRDVN